MKQRIIIKKSYFQRWASQGLFAVFLVINTVSAQTVTGTTAADLGLSSYRHFIIYPHLEKALKAQENQDETTALREFEHIYKQAPDSIPLMLYLFEAYRHFGHDDRAKALLQEKIKTYPNNTQLQQLFRVFPVPAKPLSALAQLEQKLQDAIYQKKWILVDQIFSQLHKDERKMTELEQSQWFNALVFGQLDGRLLQLQSEGLFNSAIEQILYASSLLDRGEQAQLVDYLANHQPNFETAELEKSWLYLLAMTQPSVAVPLTKNLVRPNLDELSWRLITAGQDKEAAQLLIDNYPYSASSGLRKTLMLRLSDLLLASPDLITAEQKRLLLQPLAKVELRQLQSGLSWFANDCEATKNLLADLADGYQANAWKRLAACYQDELPGFALYAYEQALGKEPSAYNQSALAYQAYKVKDYKKALSAWQRIKTQSLSDQDLLAATDTAQQANDRHARDLWLAEQKRRDLDNTETYWWLHAQRYLPNQPELALADFSRAIEAKPSARAYASRAAIYNQQGMPSAAVDDLRNSLLLDPDNRMLQADLGYALWNKGDAALSLVAHEKALEAMPDDINLLKQLTYVNQRLDHVAGTQRYARQVIDRLHNQVVVEPLSTDETQTLFDFRRVHEDIDRRWTFNFDTTLGLSAGAVGSANPATGATSYKSYRSFGQMELNYQLGHNQIIDGDLLSLYGRVYADTGTAGNTLPVKNPTLGVGVRWKPLRDSIVFVALERQVPLSGQGDSDTMLRLSASFLNSGSFSDEWHPNGNGWFAQNLYLDAAYYLEQNVQSWVADYRFSWHHKVAQGQTIEPYAHLQTNGYRNKGATQGAQLIGLGARWNVWTGESQYNAWPHKLSVGLEYQRTLNTVNQPIAKRNNLFLTFGVRW